MDDKYKKVYDGLSPLDRKAFREAIETNNHIAISSYMAASEIKKDIENIPEKKPGRGRPHVASNVHCAALQNETYKQLRTTKNTTPGAAADDLDINEFIDLYNDTIDRVCVEFYEDHPDMVKKSPFMWYNNLLLELKKQLPIISIKDPERVAAAWEAFKALMYKIGLFPMMEAFTNLTGIYKETLYNQLNPAYISIREKIFRDCRDNMISQVGYNPMTQVNKLFLLKSVYGFREDQTPQHINQDNTKKNIDDIPIFSIEDKQENN